MNMKERFAGETGRRILLEVLKDQKLIAGNAELADQVASIGELIDVKTGTAIIEQGADDNDVYLILLGSFDIVVNNRVVARRFANDHMGEMVAIQPTQKRSATVVAREEAVVVKLLEPQFAELSAKYPQILPEPFRTLLTTIPLA
jgi:CRP-like cAMP-binding protein